MRLQLERLRTKLQELHDLHEPMKAVIDQHLEKYDDALQPPLQRQISYLHQAQRLIKIAHAEVYKYPELLKKVMTASDPLWNRMKELPISKELKDNIAQQLFQSSGAQQGEKIIIATTEEGKEIAETLIVLCLRNGVDFELGIKDSERMMLLINALDDAGLQKLTELNLNKYEGVHREIIISSATNPEIKKLIDLDRMKVYKTMNQEIHQRAMSGDLHYTLTRIPTPYDAKLDGFEYLEYLQLFFELCDQPWQAIQEAQQLLLKKFDAAKELQITNDDGTDVTLNIEGMTFANSVIAKNLPGSEIFSAPMRDGVNGVVVSKGRFQYGSSQIMEDLRFEFQNGRLENFSADKGQEDLERIICADDEHGEGTRHVGEIGIGTNPHLRKHVVNSLLVEKIGGSFHLALGSCYTYSEYLGDPVALNNGNVSYSGTHWDITTLLRGKDGKMILDNELVQDNGDWVGEELKVLNEGWATQAPEDRPQWWNERYPHGYTLVDI
jgi:aminopeptidase